MPSLMATLGLNASGFRSNLNASTKDAETAGDRIMRSLNKSRSTVSNPREAQSKGDAYGKEFGEALLKRDIETATRSNRARALLRQRAESRGNVKIDNAKQLKSIGTSLLHGDLESAAVKGGMLVNKLGLLKYVLHPVTGIILGLVAGFYAAHRLAGALVQTLSGLKFPDMNTDYIAKHLQKINAVAQSQKEINKEIEKSVELYNSAASAAKRVEDRTKSHYSHLEKMNQYQEQEELKTATSDQEKDAIRTKYSAKALRLKEDERNEEVKNKKAEFAALVAESDTKKKQGDDIKVNSKEHDAQLLEQKKKSAAEAQKYLDNLAVATDMTKSKKEKQAAAEELGTMGGFSRFHAQASHLATGGYVPGTKAIDAALAESKAEALRRVKAGKDAEETVASNDELRKKKSELYTGSAASGSNAATAMLEADEMASKAKQDRLDAAEEERAKLSAENAGGKKMSSNSRNSLQTIGAYGTASPREEQMLETSKNSEKHLREIKQHLAARSNGHSANRAVNF